MKVSLIVPDKTLVVTENGKDPEVFDIDLSGIDCAALINGGLTLCDESIEGARRIHAIQWDGESGYIEFADKATMECNFTNFDIIKSLVDELSQGQKVPSGD